MNLRELNEIIQGKGTWSKKQENKSIGEVVIDSRKVHKGDVFFALVGKSKDGHDYLKEVLKKKPSCIVINDSFEIETTVPIIRVDDTLTALHCLAAYYRKNFNGIVIAITGSCGKTSTKDMLAHLLESKYNVLKNEKNYNNHIGVPLTLLKLNPTVDVLVIECGTNHPGELEVLGKLVEPDITIITNIGTSHIGNFKTQKAIFKEKVSLIKTMEDGIAIINGDDPLLRKFRSKKVEVYQTYNRNSIISLKSAYCSFLKSQIIFEYMNRTYEVDLQIPGKGMVDNLLLAIECSLFLNVDINHLLERIETLPPIEQRLEKIDLSKNNCLIDDCYNASFESMVNLLQILRPLPEHKVIILGDMKELGASSTKLHHNIGKQLKKIENRDVFLIGDEFKKICSLDRTFHWYPDMDSLMKGISTCSWKDSVIAVKGSHAMELSKVCDYIKDYYHQ